MIFIDFYKINLYTSNKENRILREIYDMEIIRVKIRFIDMVQTDCHV